MSLGGTIYLLNKNDDLTYCEQGKNEQKKYFLSKNRKCQDNLGALPNTDLLLGHFISTNLCIKSNELVILWGPTLDEVKSP